MLLSEIGQSLAVTQTNITKLIDGLVQSGHVRRVEDANDKRRTWAQLTDAGVTAFEEVLPEVLEQIVHVWSGLKREEKRLLVHLLARLRLSLATSPADEDVQRAAGEDEI
jgi:MarR family 2-MHQ and catechol resistance regulon transcriptional repressor